MYIGRVHIFIMFKKYGRYFVTRLGSNKRKRAKTKSKIKKTKKENTNQTNPLPKKGIAIK